MSLREYKRKRDFKRTAEPEGRVERGEHNRFVIQKHAASHLHYDFRLEMEGTLKSWAVPKGVPYAKGEKRLAVEVEDHPVSYIDFEGAIPKGQYGGGTVMVWDCGTYESLSKTPAKELAGGKLHFILDGKKLKGEWYLVRLRDSKQWLLIRGGEGMRPVSKKAGDTSALSGKNMKQLAGSSRVWESKPAASARPAAKVAARTVKRAKPPNFGAELSDFVEPMKARIAEESAGDNWQYEVKFDGFRALAIKRGNRVSLLSRNRKDLGGKFPEIVAAVAGLKSADAIVDGEIVALDKKGRSSFQLLQAYDIGEKRPPIFFYAFDLLRFDGKNLMGKTLLERKQVLQGLLKGAPPEIRFSASITGSARQLLKKATALGLEGLVAKRPDSIYEPGQRSGAWIKLKLRHEQEFIIGGYTNPVGSRKHFGALLIGYFEKGELKFAGKVGTGFTEKLLKSLHQQFERIEREGCPFVNLPEKSGGRGQAITASQMKLCHWVELRMICEIAFSEWTRDGKLRQPAFLGLRDDKKPSEVVRERAQ